MKLLMILFMLAGLALNGQTTQDVENGTASLPKSLLPIAVMLFPACPTEDSDWCVWDETSGKHNGLGDSFLSIEGYGVIFQ